MSMSWFKLHHEIVDDIKIRRFSPQEKWAWIVLLCLASKSSIRGTITADNDDLADYCEFNCTQDWLYYRDKLIAKGMIEINATGGLTVIHWGDRQAKKPSDDPARIKERVSKSRAKKKSQSAQGSERDVTRYTAIQDGGNASVSPQTRLDQTRLDQTRSDTEKDFSLSLLEDDGFKNLDQSRVVLHGFEDTETPDPEKSHSKHSQKASNDGLPSQTPNRRSEVKIPANSESFSSDVNASLDFEDEFASRRARNICEQLSQDPEFVPHIQKYLSAFEVYKRKGGATIADARSWITKGKRDPERYDQVKIRHEELYSTGAMATIANISDKRDDEWRAKIAEIGVSAFLKEVPMESQEFLDRRKFTEEERQKCELSMFREEN